MQFPFQQLIHRRLKTKGGLFKKTATTNHGHFVTESSLQAGRLVVFGSFWLGSSAFHVRLACGCAFDIDFIFYQGDSELYYRRCWAASPQAPDRQQDGEPVTDSVATVRECFCGRCQGRTCVTCRCLIPLRGLRIAGCCKAKSKWPTGCKKHLDLAYTMDRFVYKNLNECSHWRDRMGAQASFCEDPVAMGMIHEWEDCQRPQGQVEECGPGEHS